jgi:hypothetical protein
MVWAFLAVKVRPTIELVYCGRVAGSKMSGLQAARTKKHVVLLRFFWNVALLVTDRFSCVTQTNTFEELHAKEQLGMENAPGIDALVAILEERLAGYRTFAPSR